MNKINDPQELRKLSLEQLPDIASEVRQYIIDVITREGGHFGGCLGVIELTIALHYVYNTPHDRLVWDTGHQAYAHKVITGRRDRLATIRKTDGLAPFLKISESPFDSFGVGHTATSLSAALAMVQAREIRGDKFHVVAVIGDGAMTGGLAFEALNNIGHDQKDLTIILNDNQMTIDASCGALCQHIDDLYQQKATTNIFESYGLQYQGPIDGHDLESLITALNQAKQRSGPQILHVRTEKGRGYQPAKSDINSCHFISVGEKQDAPKYNHVFGNALVEMAVDDPAIVAITPAMRAGSCLQKFADQFPKRFFDVGIAEQHAVTFAAGLASQGIKPFIRQA